VSQKVVWHVVKGFAKRMGLTKLAPHDLRRYAECRIMPNPSAPLARSPVESALIEVEIKNDAA